MHSIESKQAEHTALVEEMQSKLGDDVRCIVVFYGVSEDQSKAPEDCELLETALFTSLSPMGAGMILASVLQMLNSSIKDGDEGDDPLYLGFDDPAGTSQH